MNIFKSLKKYVVFIFLAAISCEESLQEFDLISIVPCTDTNVIENPFIISDFECQNNVTIEDLSIVRNPTETGINTSLFVGEYTDGSSANDGLTINYGSSINLSENGVFRFKLRSQITGELQVKLQNDSSGEVALSSTVFGGDGWQQQEFEFNEFEGFSFNKIIIVFNAGVETNGEDIYYIDDLRFDPTIDPCEDIEVDLSVINDFECQQNYFLGDPNQGDTVVPIVDNPSISGINTSESVGQYTDNGTEPFDNLLIDFGEPIDLSANAQFSIKVFSSIQAPVIAKLEGGSADVERTATIQEANQWVELTFDFTEAQGAGNTRLILFFNAGNNNGTEDDIYYIDDLRFVPFVDVCAGVVTDLSIISDFECQQNYTLANANGIPVVDNPNPNDVNDSDLVGSYTDDGTEPFDFLLVDFGQPFDLSGRPELNIKVLSSSAVPLTAKLEGGTTPLEITANIDVVDEWKNYKFDFTSAIGSDNTRLVIFFNSGQTDGSIQDIYYIDDIRFTTVDCSEIVEDCTGVQPDLSIVNDFDCQQNYGAFGAGFIVQNPNISCENRSSNVGQYTDNGTDPFDALIISFGQAIDLSVNNQFKIKVLSSMAAPLLAKLEGGTTPVEIYQDIAVVGEWTEISYDFSVAQGNGNTTLVLFFNAAETNGTLQDIYYIDDLRFEAP
ncbi:hypothetical protein ACFQ1M_00095 [Sungkyunkwania multivorans]|uniref:Uncharacterized protein n=1 Tax=Sungkyunkwania multivorans TaxID=1173618 RepID=A0ABW3CT28_9FLAO